MGASGSGKSLFIKAELRRTKPRRLVVWDPLGEYPEFGAAVRTLGELLAAARALTFRRVFHPSGDPEQARKQFDG